MLEMRGKWAGPHLKKTGWNLFIAYPYDAVRQSPDERGGEDIHWTLVVGGKDLCVWEGAGVCLIVSHVETMIIRCQKGNDRN